MEPQGREGVREHAEGERVHDRVERGVREPKVRPHRSARGVRGGDAEALKMVTLIGEQMGACWGDG